MLQLASNSQVPQAEWIIPASCRYTSGSALATVTINAFRAIVTENCDCLAALSRGSLTSIRLHQPMAVVNPKMVVSEMSVANFPKVFISVVRAMIQKATIRWTPGKAVTIKMVAFQMMSRKA